MDTGIGIGLLIGAVTGSSIYIWNSEHFTKSQKITLLVCMIFPPAQWILAVIIFLLNKTSISEKSNLSNKTINSDEQYQKNHSIKEQKDSLLILKEKGILTESEYQEKINIIDEQIIITRVQSLSEYQNLKKVYQSELLTKEQFDEKTNKLISDYKQFYSIFGENNYSEFTWELFNTMKLDERINPYDYEISDLLGKWNFKNGQIFLYEDQTVSKKKINVVWNNGLNKYGEWELENQQLIIKQDKYTSSKRLIFRIDSLGSHILVCYIDESKYTCIKESKN